MKTIVPLILLLSLPCSSLLGNGLEITNVTPNADYTQVSFDVSWKNSWRQTERFHDAVWVFVKYRPDNGIAWEPASITGGIAEGDLEIITEEDSVGIFIRNENDFTGNVPVTNITLNVTLNPEIIIHPDFKVFGIEMVYVPEGPFKFGDGTIISDPDLPDTESRSLRDENKVVQGSIDSSGYQYLYFEGGGLGYACLKSNTPGQIVT